jgi:hypothetical protein
VTTTSWGRSLADATEALAPPCSAGDDASPPPAPQPLAAPLTACPVTNRRPRDLAAFQAACAAANGQPVVELDAVAAQPGHVVWHLGSFRAVTDVSRDGGTVSLWLHGDGTVPSRYLDGHLPLYRLQEEATRP